MHSNVLKKLSLLLLMTVAFGLNGITQEEKEKKEHAAKIYYALRSFGSQFVNGLVWNAYVTDSVGANIGGAVLTAPTIECLNNEITKNGWAYSKVAGTAGFVGYVAGSLAGHLIKTTLLLSWHTSFKFTPR